MRGSGQGTLSASAVGDPGPHGMGKPAVAGLSVLNRSSEGPLHYSRRCRLPPPSWSGGLGIRLGLACATGAGGRLLLPWQDLALRPSPCQRSDPPALPSSATLPLAWALPAQQAPFSLPSALPAAVHLLFTASSFAGGLGGLPWCSGRWGLPQAVSASIKMYFFMCVVRVNASPRKLGSASLVPVVFLAGIRRRAAQVKTPSRR